MTPDNVIETLEAAYNGLNWYRGMMAGAVNGSDDEMDAQIKAAVEWLRGLGVQEPVHWRAVLDPEQAPQQVKTTMHVVGFREKKAAEGFVAEQIDFYGWRYTIEPLYASPVAQQPQGEVIVTWNHDRTCILAVTRQDREGRILKVIAEAPAQQPQPLTRDRVRDIFMAHGFTIKDGQTDLKEYVYEAAAALLAAAQQPQAEAVLRKLEWAEVRHEYREAEYFCPICDRDKRQGHEAGCELAAALTPQQPQAEPLTDEQRLGWYVWRVKDLEEKLANAHKQPQAEAVPEGYKLLKDTTHQDRSWPEDAAHENGCYHNTCINCLRGFTGHKRRGICRACDALTQP